jgi:hypothetical protein
MSTLNGQDSFDTEAGLLKAFISGALDAIDEERAHDFGIDQRVLDYVHASNVVPLTDYMIGYVSLQHSEPYGSWYLRGEDGRRRKEWIAALEERGILNDYPQVIQVFEGSMTHFGDHGRVDEQRGARIVVWLTRKGLLLVWLWFGGRQKRQILECFDSSGELCKFVSTTLEGYEFGYDHQKNPKKPLYLQLRLAQGLVNLLEDVRMRRNEINARFDVSIEAAQNSQARIIPGEYRSFLRP